MPEDIEEELSKLEEKYGSMGYLRRTCSNSEDILEYAHKVKSDSNKWYGGTFIVSLTAAILLFIFSPSHLLHIVLFLPIFMMVSMGSKYWSRKKLAKDLVQLTNRYPHLHLDQPQQQLPKQ